MTQKIRTPKTTAHKPSASQTTKTLFHLAGLSGKGVKPANSTVAKYAPPLNRHIIK